MKWLADKEEIAFAGNQIMIRLTRLNRTPLVVNCDLIEHVAITPDTVIFMTTGQKFVVIETPDVVIERIRDFRRSIGCGWRTATGATGVEVIADAAPDEESN